MAVGDGAVRVPPSPQAPPRLGLLPSSLRPTATQLGLDSASRWLNGLIIEEERCLGDTDVPGGYSWEDCGASVPSDPSWPDGARGPRATWMPYTLEDGDECSGEGWNSQDFTGRARRTAEANFSRKIELELWTGRVNAAAGLGNDWLANPSTAEDLGPAPAAYALGELVQYLAETIPGRGMIHAMPRLVSLWDQMHLVRREGNIMYENTADHIVVPGTGYPGSGLDTAGHEGQMSGPSADISGSTAYATGMVSVLDGGLTIRPDSWDQAWDRTTNLVTWQAQRYVLVWFGPCAHASIEVDHANPCSITIS